MTVSCTTIWLPAARHSCHSRLVSSRLWGSLPHSQFHTRPTTSYNPSQVRPVSHLLSHTQLIMPAVFRCLRIYNADSPQKAGLVFKRGLLFTCPDEYTDYMDDDEETQDELDYPTPTASRGSSMHVLNPQIGRRGLTEKSPLLLNPPDPADMSTPQETGPKRRSFDMHSTQPRTSHSKSSSH